MKQKLDRVTFRTSRLLDFASKKELTAQTGHRPDAWPLVILKELVDNALDACEDAGVPPEVLVTVDETGITVEDNGPGIPAETVKGVLDFSVRVSSREAYVSPTRGAQGNALKTILAMPLVLDGERGRVDVSARGIRHEITMAVDRLRQEPVIAHEEREDPLVRTGTAIRVHWPDSACSILRESWSRFLQFAGDYAWLNPHLSLRLRWDGREVFDFKATDPRWAKWLPSDPTSPHWYRPENLERLIAAYACHDADRKEDRTVRAFVSEFRGLSASAKQKVVLEETGTARMTLSELMNANGLKEKLLDSMKAHTKNVKPLSLGVIGEAHMRTRAEALGAEMASFQYRRAKGEENGAPWVAETAFIWLGEQRGIEDVKRRFVTGVNWSPGILNPFRELGRFGQSLDSVLEQERVGKDEPVIFLLHMACPRVEYTDRGKSAVVIEDEEE
jgi:DNA topoisomerase VI subunit B